MKRLAGSDEGASNGSARRMGPRSDRYGPGFVALRFEVRP